MVVVGVAAAVLGLGLLRLLNVGAGEVVGVRFAAGLYGGAVLVLVLVL